MVGVYWHARTETNISPGTLSHKELGRPVTRTIWAESVRTYTLVNQCAQQVRWKRSTCATWGLLDYTSLPVHPCMLRFSQSRSSTAPQYISRSISKFPNIYSAPSWASSMCTNLLDTIPFLTVGQARQEEPVFHLSLPFQKVRGPSCL